MYCIHRACDHHAFYNFIGKVKGEKEGSRFGKVFIFLSVRMFHNAPKIYKYRLQQKARFFTNQLFVKICCRHHRRLLEEIPYQQHCLKGTIKTAYLCNIDWLVDKLQTSSVYNVMILLYENNIRIVDSIWM